MEWLLSKTIEAGRTSGALTDKSLKRVAVDATVKEKNIAHPADARLYERARALLTGLAKEAGIDLRQSYARLVPRLAGQVGRYAPARQLKGYVCRLPVLPMTAAGSPCASDRTPPADSR